MTTTYEKERYERRSRTVTTVGVLCMLVAAGFAIWLIPQRYTATDDSAESNYRIEQTLKGAVGYRDNSFYANGPAQTDTAYLASLTDSIAGTFRYTFQSANATNVSYTYDVKSTVRGTYTLTGKEDEAANVWLKQIQLVSPKPKTAGAGNILISDSVTIPFEEYKKMIDDYRSTLQVPVNGEAIVTFTVRARGAIDGVAFNDVRTSTITIPLTQQIYQLAIKYDKDDVKQVLSTTVVSQHATMVQYGLIATGVLAAVGLCLVIVGQRRRIFKTPYRAELDRIYRYHDGIIIRAKELPDLSGKRLVPVKSFDDMLNLEEELKVPIVSCEVNEEATRFMIIRDDVVYQYLLGKLTASDSVVLREIQEAFSSSAHARSGAGPQSVKKPASHRKIQ